jgi:hypothetical protein
MSQDNSALIPVPFHGTTLTLIDRDGQPYVAMRPLVEAMGMTWQSQHIKIKERYTTSVTEIVTQIPGDDQRRAMTCLPLCKIGGWLMTIHANKVRPELRERILAYQAECDEALWNYWSKGHATRGPVQFPPEAPPAPPPPKADPLTDPRVRSAINRKAHALSMAAFERNVETLERLLRQAPDLTDPDAAIARLHALELDHGIHVLANIQLLADVTSAVRTVHRAADHAMQAIARLDATTGRKAQGD